MVGDGVGDIVGPISDGATDGVAEYGVGTIVHVGLSVGERVLGMNSSEMEQAMRYITDVKAK